MGNTGGTGQTETERDPGRWMALYSVIVVVLAVTLGGAMMGLIAPAVAQDLGAAATIGLISWVSMLMLAAFILGGGTLGDIYGRKRVFRNMMPSWSISPPASSKKKS